MQHASRDVQYYLVTQAQYLASLEVLGRLWAASGNPAPLPDGPSRRTWQTVPLTLTGDLIPAAFGYCACPTCIASEAR